MQNPSYTITLDAPKKKRGRPSKKVPQPTIKIEKPVDFKELCQKLQEALAKSYCDFEQLEQNVNYLRNELQARDVVIRYLESKIK